MRVFKSELRQALRDPARLPGDELSESVHYDNGSDEAFLVWLWRELYGDEPFDASILSRLKALPEPFAERLRGRASHNVYKAARDGEWDKALQMLLAGLTESNAPVSPAEHGGLATLLAAIGRPAGAITALSVSAAGPATVPQNHRSPFSGADA
jgi:hypothetical protein